MKNEALSLSDYTFTQDDKLLLDANVWLYIYGPNKPEATKKVTAYSEAWKRMLKAQCRIYINVLVVSEFINRYARLKWSNLKKPCSDFKRFRKSEGFKPIAKNIADDMKLLLKNCCRVDDGFESIDIDTVITEYASGDVDFNDQIIALLCQRENLQIVTHDADFRNLDVPIITANRRLLT